MYDLYHDDFERDDAEHIVQQSNGCGHCDDLAACRQEGACIAHLDTCAELARDRDLNADE